MARYLLLAGIFAFTSVNLHAQENESRDTAAALPNFVAQKLSLPPAGTALKLGDATRMPETTTKSILYVGSHNRDSFNLDLPQMKNKNFEFRLQTGKNQPLYWQSIHY